MQTVLYLIWFGIPLIYSLVALYSFLESRGAGKDNRKREATGLIKQAAFLWTVGVCCLLFDRFVIVPHGASLIPGGLPADSLIIVVRLFIFPLFIFLGAVALGGSAPVRLKKDRRLQTMKRGSK